MKTLTTVALSLSLHAPFTLADTYARSSSITGLDFFLKFKFEAIPDPTHGRVNYVDELTAVAHNLAYATPRNTFVMRADDKSVLQPNGTGRESVRLLSRKSYTTHVAVFNILHMPQGCGTWPAVWETSTGPWPDGGEVDIVEGVNDQSPNAAALHTSPNCTMPDVRDQTGIATGNNCDTKATHNSGCGVKFTEQNTYGPSFNAQRGGWYAMERTDTFIKIWFWSRHDPSVPADVVYRRLTVNTDNWGTPSVLYPSTSCDIPSHFVDHHIIINLTFCGDYAGNVYPSSGCPSTCVDFVNNNPAAFKDAYFEFASINVYEKIGCKGIHGQKWCL